MDIADLDGDGRLTHAEHVRWIGSLMNVPADEAAKIALRLDADGDGFIDRHEILEAIRAYYFDEDPGVCRKETQTPTRGFARAMADGARAARRRPGSAAVPGWSRGFHGSGGGDEQQRSVRHAIGHPTEPE